MDSYVVQGITIGLVILGYLATHYRTKTGVDLDNRLVKLETKMEPIAGLDNRLGKLETKVDLYFEFQERYNAQILHRDDDKRNVDKILEKIETLEPVTKTEDEVLETTLTQIISDSNEIMGTRAAAVQLLAVRKARNGPGTAGK